MTDLDLDAEFCRSDKDRCIEICENRNFLYSDAVMKITVLQEIIDKMKTDGADHVEIIRHADHHGYEFYGSKIKLSTEAEISKYEKNKSEIDQVLKEIMELECQIVNLRKKMSL